jgi:hypothetical protein
MVVDTRCAVFRIDTQLPINFFGTHRGLFEVNEVALIAANRNIVRVEWEAA